MEEKVYLRNKIEELRALMHELIIKEGNLLNFNVIKVSQDLDKVLNEYNIVDKLNINWRTLDIVFFFYVQNIYNILINIRIDT